MMMALRMLARAVAMAAIAGTATDAFRLVPPAGAMVQKMMQLQPHSCVQTRMEAGGATGAPADAALHRQRRRAGAALLLAPLLLVPRPSSAASSKKWAKRSGKFTAAELEGFEESDSGLQFKELQGGSGATAVRGEKVAAHFSAYVLNSGQLVDSSYEREEPITFAAGTGLSAAAFLLIPLLTPVLQLLQSIHRSFLLVRRLPRGARNFRCNRLRWWHLSLFLAPKSDRWLRGFRSGRRLAPKGDPRGHLWAFCPWSPLYRLRRLVHRSRRRYWHFGRSFGRRARSRAAGDNTCSELWHRRLGGNLWFSHRTGNGGAVRLIRGYPLRLTTCETLERPSGRRACAHRKLSRFQARFEARRPVQMPVGR